MQTIQHLSVDIKVRTTQHYTSVNKCRRLNTNMCRRPKPNARYVDTTDNPILRVLISAENYTLKVQTTKHSTCWVVYLPQHLHELFVSKYKMKNWLVVFIDDVQKNLLHIGWVKKKYNRLHGFYGLFVDKNTKPKINIRFNHDFSLFVLSHLLVTYIWSKPMFETCFLQNRPTVLLWPTCIHNGVS